MKELCMADLVSFLVELATNPDLQTSLSSETLEQYGITDPAAQTALLEQDKAALLALIGAERAELNNNGTVYALRGTMSGQIDTIGKTILLLMDADPYYDLTLSATNATNATNLKARIVSGVLEVKSSATDLPDAD
jgi:hypothetical protein